MPSLGDEVEYAQRFAEEILGDCRTVAAVFPIPHVAKHFPSRAIDCGRVVAVGHWRMHGLQIVRPCESYL
jgi:hypothetical protein